MYFKNIKYCLQFYDTKIQGYVYEMSNFVNDFFLTYSYYLGIIVKQSIVVKRKEEKIWIQKQKMRYCLLLV